MGGVGGKAAVSDGAPLLLFAIAVVLAAGAALVMRPNVMQQAAFVVPLCFGITSSVLAYMVRRYVVPRDQQGPNFRFIAFWGNVGLMVLILMVFLVTAYFGVVTLIEGMVVSVVLFVAGQYGLVLSLIHI